MLIRMALLTLATALLSACATTGTGDERPPPGQATFGSEPTPSPTAPVPTASSSEAAGGPVRLEISAGDVELVATLRDTAAARDLVAQLPLTLTVRDHGGVEKTGPLPHALSVAGAPEGADPDVADLGYYAPSNDLVLYYGDQSYYDGIVILGRLQGDVRKLAEVTGDLEVRVRRLAP